MLPTQLLDWLILGYLGLCAVALLMAMYGLWRDIKAIRQARKELRELEIKVEALRLLHEVLIRETKPNP